MPQYNKNVITLCKHFSSLNKFGYKRKTGSYKHDCRDKRILTTTISKKGNRPPSRTGITLLLKRTL
jgi:hypothetical protein